jgi:hypothetical protein
MRWGWLKHVVCAQHQWYTVIATNSLKLSLDHTQAGHTTAVRGVWGVQLGVTNCTNFLRCSKWQARSKNAGKYGNWQENDSEVTWLMYDMGTGKPMIMCHRYTWVWDWVWVWVCWTHATLYPFPRCHGYAWVFWLPTFRSGEWSYDLVDSLTLTTQHFETTPTTHHHHSTPNHHCEQLLAGWKQGVRTVSKQPQWP